MKAVTFQGPLKLEIKEVDDPAVQEPNDVILKITSTAICGSDLHAYDGRMPLPATISIAASITTMAMTVSSSRIVKPRFFVFIINPNWRNRLRLYLHCCPFPSWLFRSSPL